MNNKKTKIIAGLLLLFLFTISLITANLNALTFDEKAHIPAGYSYLKYNDFRINPEHPPLIKSFSSLPLLFMDLNFPYTSENWQHSQEAPRWWVQFDLGNEFLYQSDNDPRAMILWSRIPMIILLLILAWFVFKWTREIGGNLAGILSLALFSFSPTMIAHGNLVTTDVGAALGTFLATYFWLKFLKNPETKNVLLASLFLGIGLLFKFSIVLLIPFFIIITIIYALISAPKERVKTLFRYTSLSLLIGIIAVVFVIWPVYIAHNYNQPIEQQIRDTRADLAPNPMPPARDLVYQMTEIEHVRHLGQYFRGLLMATQRTGFGNTVYFLGEMSAEGWWYYFPLIYLMKEPIALNLLTILVLLTVAFIFLRKKKKIATLSRVLQNNFVIFSLLIFIAIYWAAALVGNLNIGIRHLIPILPFVYLILAVAIKKILTEIESWKCKKHFVSVIIILFAWYAFSSLATFPHYIPYYNELSGGTNKGYLHAVDSNYCWGQDFYRLIDFIEEKEIDEIYIDYFGGEDPNYWLPGRHQRFDPKDVTENENQEIVFKANQEKFTGWLAVSVNHLMGGTGTPIDGFDQETGYYNWIIDKEPVARAGKSIFIYYIN